MSQVAFYRDRVQFGSNTKVSDGRRRPPSHEVKSRTIRVRVESQVFCAECSKQLKLQGETSRCPFTGELHSDMMAAGQVW